MQQRSYEYHENAIHGKKGFPMVVYQNDFTTYRNQRIPWHWHEELEFVVVTQGAVEFSVAGEVFVIEENDGIFMNANTLHRMRPVGEEKAYMFSILIHGGMLASSKAYLLATEYVEPYIQDEQMPFHRLCSQSQEEKKIVEQLFQINEVFLKEQFGYEYQLHNIACDIWYRMIGLCWKQKPKSDVKREMEKNRIYQALQFIHEHYQENIGLDDICRASSISRSECCRSFQRSLQMSPFSYLGSYRIERGAELLLTTKLSITEIAIQTGFNDDSYFCKMFKKYMNCTPLKYRKQNEE